MRRWRWSWAPTTGPPTSSHVASPSHPVVESPVTGTTRSSTSRWSSRARWSWASTRVSTWRRRATACSYRPGSPTGTRTADRFRFDSCAWCPTPMSIRPSGWSRPRSNDPRPAYALGTSSPRSCCPSHSRTRTAPSKTRRSLPDSARWGGRPRSLRSGNGNADDRTASQLNGIGRARTFHGISGLVTHLGAPARP